MLATTAHHRRAASEELRSLRSACPEGRSGAWAVERFAVSEREATLHNIRIAYKPGLARRKIEAGTYTRLVRGRQTCVMSDTPAELRDLSPLAANAKGVVLINGLGLGLATIFAANAPWTERVVVVEKSPDVLALVADHVMAACPAGKVEIVEADAFDWTPPSDARYDAAWHDVWDDIAAGNLPQMAKLKRRHARRAGWQGCWAEEDCRLQPR